MIFFATLLIEGALAGAIYALIALAFVLVYKSSRVVNFALGAWVMFGALLAATGEHLLGLGLGGAAVFAACGMALFGLAFNAIVIRHLTARPVVSPVLSLIMVTIGLGVMMRGGAALIFAGIPKGLSLPIPLAPLHLHGILISRERLAAGVTAAIGVALVTWFYRRSRIGIALRAIADDPRAALGAGVDIDGHFGLLWAATGVIAVAAGVLWAAYAGSGFGMALIGLKIFPIVVIGGLESLPGTIVAAVLIGIFDSLGTGYLDPQLGGGFSGMASYLLLIVILLARPWGLFGRPPAERI